VVPSNHKWFRNLAISEILADAMEDMGLKLPPTQVDIAEIRRKYHTAAARQAGGNTSRRRRRTISKLTSTRPAMDVTPESRTIATPEPR
jgi:hypothetical protein